MMDYVEPHDALEDSTGHIVIPAPVLPVTETLEARLLRLTVEIHAANVEAGWWTDIKTGESILETRNRAEMMMLVVSELSEASEGASENAMDDKLPYLPMFQVELADTAIRLFDMLGADRCSGFDIDQGDWVTWFRHRGTDTGLMLIVNHVSAAMEHYRKGRTAEYLDMLAAALLLTFDLAAAHDFDLFDVIEQKREVNRNRADHKIENRLKDDGKKF